MLHLDLQLGDTGTDARCSGPLCEYHALDGNSAKTIDPFALHCGTRDILAFVDASSQARLLVDFRPGMSSLALAPDELARRPKFITAGNLGAWNRCPRTCVRASVRSEHGPASPRAYLRIVAQLGQAEADALLAMEKHRADNTVRQFPLPGDSLLIPLKSADGAEAFVLDVQRKGLIKLSKVTYQARARKEIILARLDIEGPPHRNPDQTEIPCPHLHVYREGFDDRWAIAAPPSDFTDTSDLYAAFGDFLRFCNVTLTPVVNPGLI